MVWLFDLSSLGRRRFSFILLLGSRIPLCIQRKSYKILDLNIKFVKTDLANWWKTWGTAPRRKGSGPNPSTRKLCMFCFKKVSHFRSQEMFLSRFSACKLRMPPKTSEISGNAQGLWQFHQLLICEAKTTLHVRPIGAAKSLCIGLRRYSSWVFC